jgi:hypothetical protein
MNNLIINAIVRAILLTALCLIVGVPASYSQIGELGIYGSVPAANRENIRYVYLQTVMAYDGSPDHFLPVNGLGNFNFYYKQDGVNGFIPGDTYRVWYYAANKTTNYGYDQVTYSPNSAYTNGVQIRAFNSPPSTARGVHGTVYGRINGVNYPLSNALILSQGFFTSYTHLSRTNGNGFFSIYYRNGYGANFLPVYYETFPPPVEYYTLYIQGSVNGCNFYETYPADAIWQPLETLYPADPDYYVTDAEYDWGTLVLEPDSCS